jgi:acyl-CoA reductase-like NAD-dependent aldehyde dehydrogenase
MIKIISPIDNQIVAERAKASFTEIENAISKSIAAQQLWQHTEIQQRAWYCNKAIEAMLEMQAKLGEELTRQMGRPIKYTPGEIDGLAERGRTMIEFAESSLADIPIAPKPGFTRFIRRQPLGIVFTIAPWNYPYLTAVNSLVPALMAGNSVLLKHSAQTLLCAERFTEAFNNAGLPEGLFQHLHLDHQQTRQVIRQDAVKFVSFTGSVEGGKAIEEAAVGQFMGVALELGGKDPGYVMADANLEQAIENLVDGAFFNSGQSCCGIERIYVHESLYEQFVEGAVAAVKNYKLGNPLQGDITLGPMVNSKSADFVRQQIADAVEQGAVACIDPKLFSANQPGTPYLAPQVLVNVDHRMSVMTEESFGPVVGIMKVADDQEAIRLMNDSAFGLTASLWSQDKEHAITVADQIETGTVFMNRCDFLDPALAWTGVKHSGRGCALSTLGYDQLTRPKSFHLKEL